MYSVASCEAQIEAVAREGTIGTGSRDAPRSLLLACSAVPFTDDQLQRINFLVREDHDWSSLPDLAEHHGFVPVVCDRLSRIPGALPDPVLKHLQKLAEQNARQTMWLTQLLFTITDLFQERGIVALPYKGPVLAEMLYGNIAAREYSDIDLLIKVKDVSRAKQALQDSGFFPELQLTSREEKAYLQTGYEYTFHGPRDRNLIELQWRVLPRFFGVDFDVSGFFLRAQAVSIGQKTVNTLGNEYLICVLCAHAAKHGWSKLSWIRDVAELAGSQRVDWDDVVKQSGKLGIRRIVAVTFQIGRKLLGTPLPASIEELINHDSAVQEIADQVCRKFWKGEERRVESLAYFRLMAQVRERVRDRLRFGMRLAVTPSLGEWSAIRLPAPLFPLYRVVRIGRFVKKILRRREYSP